MNSTDRQGAQGAGIVALAVAVAVAIAAKGFLGVGSTAQDVLPMSDNDAITRFLSVRDWLAGQGWYDMTLHRVMPPEGVSLHWSRYVDLGIAAVVGAASLIVPMQTAEAAALVLWPAMLLLTLILASARAGYRLFGPVAGAVAALAVVAWPVTNGLYFGPGRVDHHNVQILLLFAVILSLVGPGNNLWRGVFGGLSAAMSLAVGLENLLPLVCVGLVLMWRQWRAPVAAAGQLGAFAVSMCLGAVLLFVGQTPPSEWLIGHCDELGPPILSLLGVAAGISLATTLATRRIERRARRDAVIAALIVAGTALAAVLFAPCAGGPYGQLPEDVRQTIVTRIVEAAPAHVFALNGLSIFYINLLPAYCAVLIATIVWVRGRRSGCEAVSRDAAGILLIFGWIGVIGSLVQIRLIVLAAPVIPLLTGYVIGIIWDAHRARRDALGPALGLITAVSSTLLLPTFALTFIIATSAPASMAGVEPRFDPDDCRDAELLGTLNVLPPSPILTYTNLGPQILLTTHHSVFAAPYHRSADALSNGIQPFEGSRTDLFAAIDKTKAEYLVLCRTSVQGSALPYAIQLAGGAQDESLIPVEGADAALIVLRIER